MKLTVKRELMYGIFVPYVVVGITAIILFVWVQLMNGAKIKEKLIAQKIDIVSSVERELDYIISNIQNTSIELENNDAVQRLQRIKRPLSDQDRYEVAVGAMQLRRLNLYDGYIKEVYLYYNQGDFFTKDGYYYENSLAFEQFGGEHFRDFKTWYDTITTFYHGNRIMRIGQELCYIVSTNPLDSRNRVNIVITLNEERLKALVEGYNTDEERYYLYNEYGLIVGYDGHKKELQQCIERYSYDFKTEKRFFEYKTEGINYMVFTGTIPKIKGKYMLVIPQHHLMQDIKNSIRYSVMIGLFFLSILSMGIYILCKKYKRVKGLLIELNHTYQVVGEQTKRYSEIEYIENTFKKLQTIIDSQGEVITDTIISKSLQGMLETDNKVWKHLGKKYKDLANRHFLLLVMEERVDDMSLTTHKLDEFIVYNTAQEVLKDFYEVHHFKFNTHQILVVNSHTKITQDRIEKINKAINNLQQYWKNHFNLEIEVVLSKVFQGIDHTLVVYKGLKDLLEYRLFLEDSKTVSLPEIEEKTVVECYTSEVHNQLINSIKSGQVDKAYSVIEELMIRPVLNKEMSVRLAKQLIQEVVSDLNKLSIENYFNCNRSEELFLEQYKTLSTLSNHLKCFIAELCSKYDAQKKGADKMTLIIDYIYEHYDDFNLNVSKVAEVFSINASYLSRRFKEKTGENLLSFINRYRVEKIKELLVETDLTLDEIAKRVGFINSVAVIRIFKKYEGITPIGYKNIHQISDK